MLAVAVLLIKLVAGTVCVADAPEKRLVSTTTISAASMPVDTVAASVSAGMVRTTVFVAGVAAIAHVRIR